jgi:hypothetical protein
VPGRFLAAVFIMKIDLQLGAEHRFGPQAVFQPTGGVFGTVEILPGSGQNRMVVPVLRCPTVPRVSFWTRFCRFQRRWHTFARHAFDLDFNTLGERIDHRNADAVQAA